MSSRPELICDLVSGCIFGELLSYDFLAGALGVSERMAIQSAVNAARPRMEQRHRKTLVCVAGIGYRVAEPSEHLGLSRQFVRKASRSLRRGQSKLVNVDVAHLDEIQRQRIVDEELALSAVVAEVDRTRRRERWRDRFSRE